MKIPEALIMLTRPGCHLCEQAAVLLDRVGISWRPVDIEDDAILEETYGLRVPVLKRPDSGRELDYPFDEARIREFAGDQPT